MGKHANDFERRWSSQGELGRKFGLSAIAVGKFLVLRGLKDSETGLATQRAIDGEFATPSPLRDGTQHFRWSTVKVTAMLKSEFEPLEPVQYWVNHVRKIFADANRLMQRGHNKAALLSLDLAFDSVPEELMAAVRAQVESSELRRSDCEERPVRLNRADLPAMAGQPWTPEQEQQLLSFFDSSIPLEEISATMQRTRGSIRSRLMRLGRMKDESNAT